MRRRVKNRTGRIAERASVIVHLPMAERAAVERLARRENRSLSSQARELIRLGLLRLDGPVAKAGR